MSRWRPSWCAPCACRRRSHDYFTDDDTKPARGEHQRAGGRRRDRWLRDRAVLPGCGGHPRTDGRLPPPRLRRLSRCACSTLVLLGVLLAACGANPTSSPTASPPTAAPPSATRSAAAAPLPSEPSPSERVIAGLALPEPGRRLRRRDPARRQCATRDVRAGSRTSSRPMQIAAALAERIWTFDGEPWTTMAIGGSCGPQTCTLEVAGTRPDRLGEDLWVFEVTRRPDRSAVASADLRSLPTELVDPPRSSSRGARFGPGDLDGLVLASCAGCPRPTAGSSS